MSKLRLQIPEMHYQTVEVEFDKTIGDALTAAYHEGEGTPVGEAVYHRTLDADEYPVRMLDENGNVEASYWYNDALGKWEHEVPMFRFTGESYG